MSALVENAAAINRGAAARQGRVKKNFFQTQTPQIDVAALRHFDHIVKRWDARAGKAHQALVRKLRLGDVDNGHWKPDPQELKLLEVRAIEMDWMHKASKPKDVQIIHLVADYLLEQHIGVSRELTLQEAADKMLTLYVCALLIQEKGVRDMLLTQGLKAHRQASEKYPQVHYDEQEAMQVLTKLGTRLDRRTGIKNRLSGYWSRIRVDGGMLSEVVPHRIYKEGKG